MGSPVSGLSLPLNFRPCNGPTRLRWGSRFRLPPRLRSATHANHADPVAFRMAVGAGRVGLAARARVATAPPAPCHVAFQSNSHPAAVQAYEIAVAAGRAPLVRISAV